MPSEQLPPNIVCADWAKLPDKRAAWQILTGSHQVEPVEVRRIDLESLLIHCEGLPGATLLGFDAALGIPAHVVRRFGTAQRISNPSFLDYINWLFKDGDPYTPVATSQEWQFGRPFIHVPAGAGSKSAFPKTGIELHRTIDRGLNANSPLIVSGLPGTVGSGSRALWDELVGQLRHPVAPFDIWPYDGGLDDLIRRGDTVVAEIYPKVCYGIALADTLPAPLIRIAKTRLPARQAALNQLLDVTRDQLTISRIETCIESEDNFDAMIATVALYKLLTQRAYDNVETPCNRAEGDILGRHAVSGKAGV